MNEATERQPVRGVGRGERITAPPLTVVEDGMTPAGGQGTGAGEPTPQRRAVIYVRVSTKEQAERDGDPEGYSIPAQREACMRRAAALDAVVVGEYVDRGESARSAARPQLQKMLAEVATAPVDFVIVHKVDRLARNRMDDVTITASIKAAGAQLVSVTENIDETPSGLLLHGIMSSIAEFYSRNLANEVIKGTQQKVASGGTASLAPIGYRNVRLLVEGRETRTVELDPERAPLIRWAFEAYATGDWTLSRLAAELEARGLTQRPSAKRAARPLNAKKLGVVLHNRYYIGIVTWRKMEHPGKHEPLISAAVFDRVQTVLAAHRQSGERAYRNHHYLAGSLRCARCDSKLIFGESRGRLGVCYQYFFCYGRHTLKNGCDLPFLPVELVEDVVTGHWRFEHIAEETITRLQAAVLEDLGVHEAATEQERHRISERVHALKRERYKWADKAMSGAIPDDIAVEKQQELGERLSVLEGQLEGLVLVQLDTRENIRRALDYAGSLAQGYESAGAATRRGFNQAWWEALYLDAEDDTRRPRVARAERTEFGEAVVTATVVGGAEESGAATDGAGLGDGAPRNASDMGPGALLGPGHEDESGLDRHGVF